jgi:hypothetical protein
MRTTIDLDDRLLVAAKQRAAADGRTLRSLVEEALRARLALRPRETVVEPLPVHRPARPGTHPGVDLTDNVAVRDLMDRG